MAKKNCLSGYRLLKPDIAINFLKKPHDVFLSQITVDPYVGCYYGCKYCYGIGDEEIPEPYRPKIGVKTNLPNMLKNRLAAFIQKIPVALGAVSEPYQPAEEEFKITRTCIEIIAENNNPLQIFTKSSLILRDMDLISEYSQKDLCAVTVTISTIDKSVNELFEPQAQSVGERLNLISELRRHDVLCGVSLAPIIPYVNDSQRQLEDVFKAVKEVGAEYIIPSGLAIKLKSVEKRIFGILDKHYKGIAGRYKALYDRDYLPALTYSKKIFEHIQKLAEKYKLSLSLPTQEAKPVDTIRIEPLM